ncbi:MAG: GDSL-type esterase/lipase family protein, partial [Clostridia bacterium]
MLKFKNGDKILFTGDSVTDAGRGRPVGEGLWEGVGTGFVRNIDTFLNFCYPESLFHVINTGTGGDTSSNLLARWECDVINIAPDYLVVCIGINDIWRQFDTPSIKSSHVSIEMYEQNLKKYITQTREKINVKEIIFMT